LVKLTGISRVLALYVGPFALLFAIIYALPQGLSGTVTPIYCVAYLIFLIYMSRSGIFAFLGALAQQKGDERKALAQYDKAYAMGGLQPNTCISYSYLLMKHDQFDKAETILKGIIEGKRRVADALMIAARSNMCLIEWKKGDPKKAIAMYEEILAKYENSMLYGSLGFLKNEYEGPEEALEFCLKAYEYNDSNHIIADNLGKAFYNNGRYEESRDVYRKLIPMNPTHAGAYYNCGMTLLKLGEGEKAFHFFGKAKACQITAISTVTATEIDRMYEETRAFFGGGAKAGIGSGAAGGDDDDGVDDDDGDDNEGGEDGDDDDDGVDDDDGDDGEDDEDGDPGSGSGAGLNTDDRG